MNFNVAYFNEFFHDIGYFNTGDTPTGDEDDTEDVIGCSMIPERAVVGRDEWARWFTRKTGRACICDVADGWHDDKYVATECIDTCMVEKCDGDE